MFSQIAFFIARIAKGEVIDSDLHSTNELYDQFLKQALTGNPKATDSFNALTRSSDERLAYVYGVMKQYGVEDSFADRELDQSLINFEWERGCLGVEILKSANPIVNW